MATLPKQNIFDFLSTIGGDSVLQADLKNDLKTSKFVFQLRKQYFEAGETLEDPLAIELVFRQIVASVTAGKATGGFDGALATLAASYYVNNEGKIPADFAKKLGKETKDAIFAAVAKTYLELLKGQKNMTSSENLADQIEVLNGFFFFFFFFF